MPDKALELRAAAVVASILGARFVSRDVGGTQLRDFDLLFADGHVEPLEITEASIRSIRNTAGRLERKDREATSLRRDWQVEMPSRELIPSGKEVAYDVDQLLRKGESLLAVVEAEGRTSFDLGRELYSTREGSELRRAFEGLLALGVTMGLSSEPPPGQTARITPGMTYCSTAYGATLADIVVGEAEDPGNRAKLAEPPNAPARHLCVVMDPSVGRAYIGLRDGRPGEAPSALPPPVTTVWGLADYQAAWMTPPGSWTLRRITNPNVFERPQHWSAPSS